MAKQNELNKLIQGKGLGALAPSSVAAKDDKQQGSENVVREKRKKSGKVSPPETPKLEKVPAKKPYGRKPATHQTAEAAD